MIDQLHQIINFATDKGVTGYHKPEDIDNEIHAVSMGLWESYWDEYSKTQKINDYMSPFVVEEYLTPVKQESDIEDPDALVNPLIMVAVMTNIIEHPTLVENEAGHRVNIIERAFWTSARHDPVAPPTKDFPVCTFASRATGAGVYTIEFMPDDVGKVLVHGLRKPIKPFWDSSKGSTGRRTFLPQRSIDLEWTELLFGTIRDALLTNMFINLREMPIKAET